MFVVTLLLCFVDLSENEELGRWNLRLTPNIAGDPNQAIEWWRDLPADKHLNIDPPPHIDPHLQVGNANKSCKQSHSTTSYSSQEDKNRLLQSRAGSIISDLQSRFIAGNTNDTE